jgi:hypothetical protein
MELPDSIRFAHFTFTLRGAINTLAKTVPDNAPHIPLKNSYEGDLSGKSPRGLGESHHPECDLFERDGYEGCSGSLAGLLKELFFGH